MVTSIKLTLTPKPDDPGGSSSPSITQPHSDPNITPIAHHTPSYNPSLSGGGGRKGNELGGGGGGKAKGHKSKDADNGRGKAGGSSTSGAKAGSSTGVGTKGRAANGGRSRPQQTRARHSHLITPAESVDTERELEKTLKGMGLYASKTIGDGNCMFRALSDQLYGHDRAHVILRLEICDYLQAHPDRYEGFVDTEKSFPEYVAIMRQNRTYGGHLELTAFARLKKRSIKVILPDYVYIVAGDDESPTPLNENSTSYIRPLDPRSPSQPHKQLGDATSTSPKGKTRALPSESEGPRELPSGEFLYLSYHIFEHYSSVRNVDGPHTGLPFVRERVQQVQLQTPPSSSSRAKPASHFQQRKEDLILASLPPTCTPSLARVTALLEQEDGNWEKVVELLVEEDAIDSGLGTDNAPDAHGASSRAQDGAIERASEPSGPAAPKASTTRSFPVADVDSETDSVDPIALGTFTTYRDRGNDPRDRQSSPIAPSDDLETATSVSSDTPITVADQLSRHSNDSGLHTDGGSSYTDSASASPVPTSPLPRPGSRKRIHTSSSLGTSGLLANKRMNRSLVMGGAFASSSSPRALPSATGSQLPSPRTARTVHSSLRGKEKREARKLRASLSRRQKIEAEAWGSNVVDDAPDDGRRLTRGRAKGSITVDDETPANKIKELYI